jgi:hypothetical protein
MGSHPTLDQTELAAEARQLDPDDWRHGYAAAHLAADHPQVRAWSDGNPDLAHDLDHRDWLYDHHHRPAERAAEQAFDRLNPEFGVPADRSDRIGHHDVAQREAALALGVRVAVHDSRQNAPTRSSGRPARTTGPPTPFTPPATSRPAPAGGRSGSAPNANQHA